VPMRNAVFWDIKNLVRTSQETLIFCYTAQPVNKYYVRIEVFSAVTMENAVLWDVKQSGSCMNRRVTGTYRLHHQGDKNRRAKNSVSSN
jgi:hypothetical protein